MFVWIATPASEIARSRECQGLWDSIFRCEVRQETPHCGFEISVIKEVIPRALEYLLVILRSKEQLAEFLGHRMGQLFFEPIGQPCLEIAGQVRGQE